MTSPDNFGEMIYATQSTIENPEIPTKEKWIFYPQNLTRMMCLTPNVETESTIN